MSGPKVPVLPGLMAGVMLLWSANLTAAPRRVLAEIITNTACSYCANANQVLTQIYEAHYNEMSVIRYHAWWPSSSDPFYQANIEENTRRINYYGADYTPHLYIDGSIDAEYQTSTWEYRIQQELQVPSPLIMDLEIQYHPSSHTGQVITTITVDSVVNFVAPKLRIALVESNIEYNAPNGEHIHHQIMRDMIPNAEGIPLSLGAGVVVVDTQTFVIQDDWDQSNCAIVAFVQDDGAGKRVYQSAMVPVYPSPDLRYHHYYVEDGNDQVLRPGETGQLWIAVTNEGRVDASDVVATLLSSDPYVTVTQAQVSYPSIPLGQPSFGAQGFEVQVDPSCPDTHLVYLHLSMMTPDSAVYEDSLPFLVFPQSGFSDDFDGEERWSNTGTWHRTTHRYHSPDRSRYNGVEGLWRYIPNADIYTISPWILVGAHDTLTFWQWYDTEIAKDFGYLYLQTSDPEHRIVLDTINGHDTTWTQVAYPLDDYAGSPVRIVFHFTSDASVQYEGWYIDDVEVRPVGVHEGTTPPVTSGDLRVQVPAPFAGSRLPLLLEIPRDGTYRFQVFNLTGARVWGHQARFQTGPHRFTLALPSLAPGVYFLQVESPSGLRKTVRFLHLLR